MTPDVATLWTAVAAAGGAVSGAAITGLVTYRLGRRQTSQALALAKLQHEHDARQAALEREHQRNLTAEQTRQSRLIEAYRFVAVWALNVDDSLVELRNGQKPEDREDIEMQARALASLVASGEVGRLVDSYSKAVTRAYAAAGTDRRTQEVSEARRNGEVLLEAMRSELGAEGLLPSELTA